MSAAARAAAAVAANPGRSARAIASEVGVHRNTVTKARKKLVHSVPVGGPASATTAPEKREEIPLGSTPDSRMTREMLKALSAPAYRTTCRLPDSDSTSDHWSSHSSEALRPCLKAIRTMVASRCPQRFLFAASIISTSRSVRCSRGRSSLFGRRLGVTVRLSVAGDTNARCTFTI
jgi:transposase-like protein